MRRRAYIKVPRPTPTYRRPPTLTGPGPKNYPVPATQTKPMMRRSRRGRRTGIGLLAPVAGWALRRIYNRMRKRKSYASEKVLPSGTGSTFSYYKSRQAIHPKTRAVAKIATHQFYQKNLSYRLETTAFGTQGCCQFVVGTAFDLHDMVSNSHLTPNATTQIHIRDYSVHTEFTNQSEATCYFDIYELTPRYSLITNKDPVDAFNNGLIDSGVANGAITLGAVPTMSSGFTFLYKIHKKYTVELAQGQSHRHVSSYNIGRRYSEEFYDTIVSNTMLPQFTRYVMIVASGAPLNDQTTKANVSTATVALDIVRKVKARYMISEQSRTKYYLSDLLPTVTTGSIMDIGSGEKETLDVA